MEEFFDLADELIITDLYEAGETPIPHVSHAAIQEEIKQNSQISCRYVPRLQLGCFLSQFVRPWDVVVTLGAGDITG